MATKSICLVVFLLAIAMTSFDVFGGRFVFPFEGDTLIIGNTYEIRAVLDSSYAGYNLSLNAAFGNWEIFYSCGDTGIEIAYHWKVPTEINGTHNGKLTLGKNRQIKISNAENDSSFMQSESFTVVENEKAPCWVMNEMNSENKLFFRDTCPVRILKPAPGDILGCGQKDSVIFESNGYSDFMIYLVLPTARKHIAAVGSRKPMVSVLWTIREMIARYEGSFDSVSTTSDSAQLEIVCQPKDEADSIYTDIYGGPTARVGFFTIRKIPIATLAAKSNLKCRKAKMVADNKYDLLGCKIARSNRNSKRVFIRNAGRPKVFMNFN